MTNNEIPFNIRVEVVFETAYSRNISGSRLAEFNLKSNESNFFRSCYVYWLTCKQALHLRQAIPAMRELKSLRGFPLSRNFYMRKICVRKWNRGNVWKVVRKRKSSTPLNPTFKGDTSYLVSILFTRVKITRQWKSTLYRLNSGNAFRTRVSFRWWTMLILPINDTRYANVPFTHQAVETLCNLSVPNESDQYQNENCHSSIFSEVLIVNTECPLKPVSSLFPLEHLCSKKRKERSLLERIYFPGRKSWLGGHRQKFIFETQDANTMFRHVSSSLTDSWLARDVRDVSIFGYPPCWCSTVGEIYIYLYSIAVQLLKITMDSSEKERVPSINELCSKIPILTEYCRKLEDHVKRRYLEKNRRRWSGSGHYSRWTV